MNENSTRRIFRIIFIAMIVAGTSATVWLGLSAYRVKEAQHNEIERAVEDVFDNWRTR
jgi:Mn2+/Fe2+ NRAMP family transporter